MPFDATLTVAMLVTIAVSASAAVLAWRERPKPGAVPLAVMLAGGCWWTAFLFFQLDATTLAAKRLWVNLSWIGVVVVPVGWFWFAMEYTGRDRYVARPYLVALFLVPAITVVLALTDGRHDLLYSGSRLIEAGGRPVIEHTAGPWYWVITGYTYLLGVLGAVPLLRLVHRDAFPFRGQSLAILVGILAPGAINALFLLGVIPAPGFDPTPVGFAISGVAYLGAIKRFRLFRASPAPNRAARRLVFERMHAGAVVVDDSDTVVDVNENAGDVLGGDPRDVLGRPAPEVIPGYDELPEDGPAPDHLTVSHGGQTRFFDPTVTRINDHRGRPIGRVVTFHDIGEHRRQNQRLEVLNRVLRHNIRNETNLIAGYADVVENPDVGEVIKDRALQVEKLAEKARNLADMFDHGGDPADSRRLGDLLDEAVESARREHPTVDVTVERPEAGVLVSDVVGPVLDNVVDNAARHNTNDDPRVRVRVEAGTEWVRVEVADNGPGIDEFERAVLESGEETPLAHGSGLGLWLIAWGAQVAGGSVTFEVNRPAGSVVTLEVPVLSTVEAGEDERDLVSA